MASSTESGHAVNVANFDTLIQKCSVLPSWSPSNTALLIPTLIVQHTDCKNSLDSFNTLVAAAKTPINQNHDLFEPLNKLTTRIVNFFDSTMASTQAKKDARGMANDIRGYNAKKPKGLAPDAEWVSQSHQSMVQKANKFKELIDFLTADGNYTPNEVALQLPTLTTLWNQFNTSLASLAAILAPIDQAEASMYRLIYGSPSGMIDMAMLAKKYAKALMGAQAIEVKAIMGIKFRRINKKLITY